MQLKDIVEAFSDLSPEEQVEKIRQVRKNRTVIRPAAQKKKREAGKKKIPKAEALLASLSPKELAELLKEIKEES